MVSLARPQESGAIRSNCESEKMQEVKANTASITEVLFYNVTVLRGRTLIQSLRTGYNKATTRDLGNLVANSKR